MKENITPIRFIPFDLGCFFNIDIEKNIKKYFNDYSKKNIHPFLSCLSKNIFFTVELECGCSLVLYKYGIGIFVITDDVFDICNDRFAVDYCQYRSNAHTQLLHFEHNHSKIILKILNDLRSIIAENKDVKNLRVSASKGWEFNGLSYVMTTSFINSQNLLEDYTNLDDLSRKNLHILLEPSIAHKEDSQLMSIAENDGYDAYDFDVNRELEIPQDYLTSTDCNLYISWAAVVMIYNSSNPDSYISLIKFLEIDLQAMWMYIYCMYNDIINRKNYSLKVADIKKLQFEIREMFNEFLSRDDSSMPKYIQRVRDALIVTSNLKQEYNKLDNYLHFCVEKAESENAEKQQIYILTSEILLFIIAAFQIIPQIESIVKGQYGDLQFLILAIIMLIILIGCYVIYRKDK